VTVQQQDSLLLERPFQLLNSNRALLAHMIQSEEVKQDGKGPFAPRMQTNNLRPLQLHCWGLIVCLGVCFVSMLCSLLASR
jgi:hypothetical protein